MNEVTTTKPQALAIPPAQVLAKMSYYEIRKDTKTYPRVKSVPAEAAQLTLQATIAKMLTLTGRNAEEENVAYMAVNLYEALMCDEDGCGTPFVSFAEIEKALRKAIFGRAKSEMFGINVASLYKAITDYLIHEGHEASMRIQKEMQQADTDKFNKSSIGIAIAAKCRKIAEARRFK